MLDILLYISSFLIIISFVGYLLLLCFNNKKITDSNSFNIVKEIISDYDIINVIESKTEIIFFNLITLLLIYIKDYNISILINPYPNICR